MAGQRGRDVLVKLSDGGDPEAFVTVAGIRTREVVCNARPVDVTSADSLDGWRELLPQASIKQLQLRGRGVFKDAQSDRRMRSVFFAGEAVRCQLTIPGLGRLTGPMQLTTLNWGGSHDGEATFSMEMESAGALLFEAL